MRLNVDNYNSITSGPRQSNFELLRIVAMFMILGLHCNFKYSGIPSDADFSQNIMYSLGRCLMECFCLPAVNVFILISGWFTIRPKTKSLSAYLYQCFFFLTITYLFYLLYTGSPISVSGIISCLGLSKYGWFIVSYLILFMLSPVINAFLDNVDRKNIRNCLIFLFLTSSFYGWIGGNSNYNNGYSAISFIALYILGRYLSLYYKTVKFNWKTVFFISLMLNTFLISIDIVYLKTSGISRLLSYVNPLIILQAVALLMIFSGISVEKGRFINYVAKSSFAVYLLHDCSLYEEYFMTKIFHYMTIHLSQWTYFFGVLSLMTLIYALAVGLDQIRILIWKVICKLFFQDTRTLLY